LRRLQFTESVSANLCSNMLLFFNIKLVPNHDCEACCAATVYIVGRVKPYDQQWGSNHATVPRAPLMNKCTEGEMDQFVGSGQRDATLEHNSLFDQKNLTIPCHVACVLSPLGYCGCVKLKRRRGGSDHATAAEGVAMSERRHKNGGER